MFEPNGTAIPAPPGEPSPMASYAAPQGLACAIPAGNAGARVGGLTGAPDPGPNILGEPLAPLGLLLLLDGAIGLCVPLLSIAALTGEAPTRPFAQMVLLTVGLALCLIGWTGGYSPRTLRDQAAQTRSALFAACIAIVAMAAATWVLKAGMPQPGAVSGTALTGSLALSVALMLALLAGGRTLLGAALKRDRRNRFAPRTVVVGGGEKGARVMRRLRSDPRGQTRLLGYIDDHPAEDANACAGAPFLGGLTQLLALIRRGGVDQVIVALPWSAQAPVLDLIGRLAECPVTIRLAPDSGTHPAPGLIHVADPPLAGWASLVKRSEDIAVALLALAALGLPMLLIAIAIRLDSPGPALFRQRRTGFNNRDFQMLKFRTMFHHLADPQAAAQATRDDPRVTRIGAWLRRTSLDELPQMVNVLRGEMSVVGPRPHAPGTRAGGRMFDQVVAHYAARHRVRPGVTGLAQVRGLRGPTETGDKLERRVDSDLEYIENWSVWLDLTVLARTAVAVLRMKNAC